MNQQEKQAATPIRISKALEAMRSSEAFKRFDLGSRERSRRPFHHLALGFEDVVLSTRTSLASHSHALDLVPDFPFDWDLTGSLDNSVCGHVPVLPTTLIQGLQDLETRESAPFFINSLSHDPLVVSPIEYLLESSETTDRFFFRLYLFNRFGADPDPTLPYARELFGLLEWLSEIVGELRGDLIRVRRALRANLGAIRKAARWRDQDDILDAYQLLAQFEETLALRNSALARDPNAQRGRRMIASLSQGGKTRSALFTERDMFIIRRFKELRARGIVQVQRAARIIAKDLSKLILVDETKASWQPLGVAGVRSVFYRWRGSRRDVGFHDL